MLSRPVLFLPAILLLPGSRGSNSLLLFILAMGIVISTLEISLLIRRPGKEMKAWIALQVFGFFWGAFALPFLGLEVLGYRGMPSPQALVALVCSWAFYLLILLKGMGHAYRISKTLLKWSARVMLVLFSSAVFFLLLELVMGPFIPEFSYKVHPNSGSPPEMIVQDRGMGSVMTPGFEGYMVHQDFYGIPVTINPEGYRDRPWAGMPAKAADSIRILGLGDSFAFGLGVKAEETFLRRLEAMQGWEGRIWTVNTGIPGYGPGHELICLMKHFSALMPDIVVMAIYTGNDLKDVINFYTKIKKKEIVLGVEERASQVEATPTETKRERIRHHVNMILPRLKEYKTWTASSKICSLLFPPLRRLAVMTGLLDPKMIYNMFLIKACALEPSPDVEGAFKLTETAVGEATRFCRDRGARFMVLIIPPLFLVDRAMFDGFFSKQSNYHRKEYSPDVMHEKLRAVFRKRGVPFLDLLPVLRDRHTEGLKLYHDEGHWNGLGHQEAADRLFEFLELKNWL
jgi:hypothetical protein